MAESPSGYFPDFFVGFDVKAYEDFLTDVMMSRSGREQRRAVFAQQFRRFTATTRDLTQSQRETLRVFLRAQKGRLGAFYFWHPFPEKLTAFPVGSVVAATSLIVPLKGNWYGNEPSQAAVAANYSNVYVNGTPITFTVTPNIGAGGEDRLNFSSQTGAVTVDATNARERIQARFDMDSIANGAMQQASDALAIYTIAIKEVV